MLKYAKNHLITVETCTSTSRQDSRRSSKSNHTVSEHFGNFHSIIIQRSNINFNRDIVSPYLQWWRRESLAIRNGAVWFLASHGISKRRACGGHRLLLRERGTCKNVRTYFGQSLRFALNGKENKGRWQKTTDHFFLYLLSRSLPLDWIPSQKSSESNIRH